MAAAAAPPGLMIARQLKFPMPPRTCAKTVAEKENDFGLIDNEPGAHWVVR